MPFLSIPFYKLLVGSGIAMAGQTRWQCFNFSDTDDRVVCVTAFEQTCEA
jgi:hypothetical protein